VSQSLTVSPSELLGRVRRLTGGFRERALVTEERRQVPSESIDELLAAGLARLLVPGEHGGADLPLDVWFDLSVMIGKACPSTGWCASLLMHLPHVIALWPDEAQEAVWADGPDVPVALSVAPVTSVRQVTGGYRVSGASPFTSGIAHSRCVGVGGMVPSAQGPDWRWFILPRDSYTVKDVWHTAAMRGTGSNVVITDDVFVPEAHAVRVAEIREGTAPGGHSNADAKFRMPFASYSGLFATSVALGAARGAFEHFVAWMANRRTPSDERLANEGAVQTATARIASQLEASEVIQRRVIEAAYSPDVAVLENRARAMSDLTFAMELTVAAIDGVMAQSGTVAFNLDNPVQRAWRDIHMAAAHISVIAPINFGHRGRMLLDVPLDPAPAVH
jgi:3-hydroxy-9,10-secoandrosta-1,3,5(10)-triene-9,17-dione monooxygenase